MNTSVSITIEKPKEEVWKAITDFENCSSYIHSILSLEILEQPKDTLVGFKWKETREMFGKEATETMWITDVSENEFYQTRAESHGSFYISQMAVEEVNGHSKLTFSFTGESVTFFAKIMSALMGSMMKKSLDKAMLKDLEDIKAYVESK